MPLNRLKSLASEQAALAPSWLTVLAALIAPLAIIVVTLTAVLAWNKQSDQVSAPQAVTLRVLDDPDAQLTAPEAASRLRTGSNVLQFETQRAESPFWFVVEVPAGTQHLEFSSRHALTLQCYDAGGRTELGYADRTSWRGALAPFKAGFELQSPPAAVVCRGTFRGPARITAWAWDSDRIAVAAYGWYRGAGLVDGGALMLAAFVLAIGIVNRRAVYLIFAAWLVANFRMAAITGGWDLQWFGYDVPTEWIYPLRQATATAFYCLTIAIFVFLFGPSIARSALAQRATSAMVWSTPPVLIACLVFPYNQFLPLLWVATAVFALLQLGLVVRFAVRDRGGDRGFVMLWFGAALTITLISSVYEVVAAAFGLRVLTGSINFVTAAITSSLLAALAVAQHVRQERQDRLRAEGAAVQALRKVEDTYRAAPVGLFTLAPHGQFIAYNPALARMLGYPQAREGMHTPIAWATHFEPADLEALLQAQPDTTVESVLHARGVDGGERWLRIRAIRHHDTNDVDGAEAQQMIEGALEDITEQRRTEAHLQWLAEHDPLTRLFNRRGAERILNRVLGAASADSPAAIGYIDLSRFKLLNDLYGHSAGDTVLTQIAERMCIAAGNHPVCRLGGDEFLLVFEGVPVEAARERCEALLIAVRDEPYVLGEREVRIGAAVGLVEVQAPINFSDALAIADRACREAKARSEIEPVVYSSKANAFTARTQELQFIRGLESGDLLKHLYLEMQPILSLQRPFAQLDFECLLRLRGADGKPVPIFQLITAAESSGFISTIDRWVFQNVLTWLNEHLPVLPNTNFVCVNLSAGSMNNERFIADLVAMLREYPKAAERVCVEITETVALHDLENSQRFVDRLREAGTKLALDDFGAGYTNLKELSKLRADVLKIDGAFIRDINKDPTNFALVQLIAQLAHELGMRTIAEWAEDARTVETLAEIGCDYAQGWAIAKPMASTEILTRRAGGEFIRDSDTLKVVQEIAAAGGLPRARRRSVLTASVE